MDYAEWILEQHARGITPTRIASASLQGPIMLPGGTQGLRPLLQQVATKLGVDLEQIHVVGSARFGFSLWDGAVFDPRFSDLDLAVIDTALYDRCATSSNRSSASPRFPELDLPAPEHAVLRRALDDLSRSSLDRFAYISIAAYPDLDTLARTQAIRVREFLGIGNETTTAPPPLATDAQGHDSFDAAMRAGIPRFLDQVSARFC